MFSKRKNILILYKLTVEHHMPLFPGMFNGCIIDLNNTSESKQPLSNPHIYSVLYSQATWCGWTQIDCCRKENRGKPCVVRVLGTKKDVDWRLFIYFWCRRPDSNRHVFLRLILNQLRLPISPLRHGKDTENVLDYTCRTLPCKQRCIHLPPSDEFFIGSVC